jgi:aconitate hydratase
VTIPAAPPGAELEVRDRRYRYHPLSAVPGTADLPFVLKLLVENLLRGGHDPDGRIVDELAAWDPSAAAPIELRFEPGRVLMHDTTGVPAMVDLATLREAMGRAGGDPGSVQPTIPVDLVIDHSLTVDVAAHPLAMERNIELEYRRNHERYRFLKWAGLAVDGVTVVPPGAGIVHQVNVEHLTQVVTVTEGVAHPDTLIGTDSHTTMVNGLGVLAWGVGGIEALAAMLGEGIALRVPEVIGVELTGRLPEGSTATDLVLRITELLRERGVVGAFVEFHGAGVSAIGVPDRATIANMSPEFGSTTAMFPIDDRTLDYLELTGRDEHQLALVESYAKAQGLWLDPGRSTRYSDRLALDLASVPPAIAGPSRPERRISLDDAATTWREDVRELVPNDGNGRPRGPVTVTLEDGSPVTLDHGDVAIAAITSCTNTSNPALMLAAGLLARNAVERGLSRKPWVKTSLAPGSQVVMDYLERAGLLPAMEELGFGLVGFGCTTCIGNSGPLPEPVASAVREQGLKLASVLSGNRNFEGRISPDVAMNYLASPPLVVAYALAGTMDLDLTREPIGADRDGRAVMLADLWPSSEQLESTIASSLDRSMFTGRYAHLLDGDDRWRSLEVASDATYDWDEASTYLREAPYFQRFERPVPPAPTEIRDARVLALLGDDVTTDHLSPAGAILPDSEAGRFLLERGVAPQDFNTYPTRRGNHEVLLRAALANPRLRNQLVPDGPGGVTRDLAAQGPVVSPREAAGAYAAEGTPLVIIAGRNYGNGSSRDWAAKGPALLGVRAVIAVDLERIHRSNLIGMGVLPLQFLPGQDADTLGLVGDESFTITGLDAVAEGPTDRPAPVVATPPSGSGRGPVSFEVAIRLDTVREVAYHRHGGIMPFVLRQLLDRGRTERP